MMPELRHRKLSIQVTALSALLLIATAAQCQQGSQYLVRTPISGRTICGLTGTALKLDESWPEPIRAWAGIIADKSGGPALKTIQHRNRVWVKQELLHNDRLEGPKLSREENAEQTARFRHCRHIHPAYFDAVLLEFAEPLVGERRFCWVVDYDIDGNLTDEAREMIPDPTPLSEDLADVAAMNSLYIEHNLNFSFYYEFPVASEKSPPANDENVRSPGETTVLPQLTAALSEVRAKLHTLDNAKTRKQHLHKVVAAADELIAAIKEQPQSDQTRYALADALYRKGRALGYMELPDVIAVHPVEDPITLNKQFEDTFQQLDSLVDTKSPEYILLRIRRERRRDRRGIALDLVDVYRKTHPNPVWHFKKRFDLMTELGARLHAHQAAAQLWMDAEKPTRPTCFLFKVSGRDAPKKDLQVSGSWTEKSPFRPKTLHFQPLPDGSLEAVAWLDAGEFTLTGAEIVSDSRTTKNAPLPQVDETARTVVVNLRRSTNE